MFIAKHELPLEPPSTSNSSNPEPSEDDRLEQSLVGFFLGEEPLEHGAHVIPNQNGTLLLESADLSNAETRSWASLPPLPSPSDDNDDI
jgi:hypothetical protein